jgi:hypothetical protein
MKDGDKAFVRLDGVVYVGTVQASISIAAWDPMVWIEWPKDINPTPSRNIVYEGDLMPPPDEQPREKR